MRHICWICVVEFELAAELDRHLAKKSHIQLAIAQATDEKAKNEPNRYNRRLDLLDSRNYDKEPGSWIHQQVPLMFCNCILDWRAGTCATCSPQEKLSWQLENLRNRRSSKKSIALQCSASSVTERLERENELRNQEKEKLDNFRSILASANRGHIDRLPSKPTIPEREFRNETIWFRVKMFAKRKRDMFKTSEEAKMRQSPLLRSTERLPQHTWVPKPLEGIVSRPYRRTSTAIDRPGRGPPAEGMANNTS